jgi:hypothetical protein
LPAGALERHHAEARGLTGHQRAVVPAHQVQAQVEGGGGACRAQDLTLVHVEHRRVDVNAWIAPRQLIGSKPMCGRTLAVEQPGGRQQESSRADRGDAHSAGGGTSERAHQRRRDGQIYVVDAGQHDRVGARELLQPVAEGELKWPSRQRALHAAHAYAIAWLAVAQLHAREDLVRSGHVRRHDLVHRCDCDSMHG